jgi:hypothetical protein
VVYLPEHLCFVATKNVSNPLLLICPCLGVLFHVFTLGLSVGVPSYLIFAIDLSTWLGHQPIQSFNLVGTPADLIFQFGWGTSRFDLSTWLGHQPIQSFNLVGTPADLIFQFGWGTSRFNLSTWLGHQPIQSFSLVRTPANSIFQLGWGTSQFHLSTWLGHQLIYL